MNGQILKTKFQFWRKAKGRHGVHSPFVFQFIEQCLNKKPSIDLHLVLLTKSNANCINRIVDYFQNKEIFWASNSLEQHQTLITKQYLNAENQSIQSYEISIDNWLQTDGHIDCLLIDTIEEKDWQLIMNKVLPFVQNESLIIVNNIRQNDLRFSQWEQITQLAEVRLSIDLFNIGLLFFKNEFKEKQHFYLMSKCCF